MLTMLTILLINAHATTARVCEPLLEGRLSLQGDALVRNAAAAFAIVRTEHVVTGIETDVIAIAPSSKESWRAEVRVRLVLFPGGFVRERKLVVIGVPGQAPRVETEEMAEALAENAVRTYIRQRQPRRKIVEVKVHADDAGFQVTVEFDFGRGTKCEGFHVDVDKNGEPVVAPLWVQG